MCPDENELLKFASGRAGELPALEAHLDGCEDCRRAVAAAASERTLPAQSVTHMLSPGQRVARYEIERELGRGGMGIVYQARDVTLDRRVALKLLHAQRDEAAQARLLREAQVMAKLTHPNVVPVFELGEWKSDLYLVMELVTGVTLEQWLKREKHRRADIIHAFVQAGRGLAAAHAAGVVHRDFKPANVLVGGDGRVRVTDFGLSRPGPALELPATDSAVVTRDGAIVGTLAYMSPEQIGGKTADERSDQFSFCVSLVEALSGLRPFDGENWAQLSQGLARKPRLAGVPRALRGVLRKGLERDASRRYTSLTALLNAIERSQQLGWSAVALTAAAALVGGVFFAWQPQPAQLAKPQPQNAVQNVAEEATVPVVMAAVDIVEGTTVTMDLIQQRMMPARYVTNSVIKPDVASYIVGQRIRVPVMQGDLLLWSQFETIKGNATMVTVMVAARDLAEGSVLGPSRVMEQEIPEYLATSSVMRPKQSAHLWGHALKVKLRRGDLLLWSHLSDEVFTAVDDFDTAFPIETEPTPSSSGPAPASAGLPTSDIMKVILSKKQELATCTEKKEPGTSGKIVMQWRVRTDGTVSNVDVAAGTESFRGTPVAACFAAVIKSMTFPKHSVEGEPLKFPFKF